MRTNISRWSCGDAADGGLFVGKFGKDLVQIGEAEDLFDAPAEIHGEKLRPEFA